MKKIILSSILLLSGGLMQAASVALTGFGSAEFTDAGSSSFIQTSTTTQYNGNDQTGTFLGTFSPVDITEFTASVTLTVTLSGTNPASNFVLQLWDGGSEFRDYSGNWGSFSLGVPTTVMLTATTPAIGSFNTSTVQGMQLLLGGSGNPLNVTFDNLTANSSAAVPEVSTYASLAGTAGLIFAMARRRRSTGTGRTVS